MVPPPKGSGAIDEALRVRFPKKLDRPPKRANHLRLEGLVDDGGTGDQFGPGTTTNM
jgi:hypothetical protein